MRNVDHISRESDAAFGDLERGQPDLRPLTEAVLALVERLDVIIGMIREDMAAHATADDVEG